MPIVYLIQPCELVGTARYKVGMSRVADLSRLKAYKNGTRYLWICECDDALLLERKLIKEFNARYKLIGGNEYFEIDTSEIDMIRLFSDIVLRHKSARQETTELNWNRFAFKQ